MPNDRILVVDDEETIREIVSSMLAGAHFQTRQAASGIEALAILESGEDFDLVLSDLMMAEMDGIALLERGKDKKHDKPIVVMGIIFDFVPPGLVEGRKGGVFLFETCKEKFS